MEDKGRRKRSADHGVYFPARSAFALLGRYPTAKMMASPRIMPAVNVLFTQMVSVLNGSECVRLGGIASIAKAVPLVSSEIEYVKVSVIIDPRKPTHPWTSSRWPGMFEP